MPFNVRDLGMLDDQERFALRLDQICLSEKCSAAEYEYARVRSLARALRAMTRKPVHINKTNGGFGVLWEVFHVDQREQIRVSV